MNLFRRLICWCFIAAFGVPAGAQEEPILMSVLASRKHRHGASDNPVVGLFRSTDQGSTWTHLGWREYIRTFQAEYGPDGTIWLACGNGVLRSTDDGATWRVTTGWEVTEVLRVRAHPDDPSRVLAATAYGIIGSEDRGGTWSAWNTGLDQTFTTDLWIDRDSPDRVLAACEGGVYLSADGAKTWKRSGLKGRSVTLVLQDPHDNKVFWAGTDGQGLFRSADGGKTWVQRSSGLPSRVVYALAIDPRNPRRMYAGTYGGGVARSGDGGRTWKASSAGLELTDIHSVLVLPSNPAIVLAGTMNGGLYRSTDGGQRWQFNSQESAQVWGLALRPLRAGRDLR